jgi:hypothetical protein
MAVFRFFLHSINKSLFGKMYNLSHDFGGFLIFGTYGSLVYKLGHHRHKMQQISS